jgi:type I restriction enzyme M protein
MQCSTVNLKDVLIDNPLFRIDAEFFKAEYFDADKHLQKHSVRYLGDISKSVVNFGAYSLCNQIEFLSEGVPFLNVGDILENWIDFEGAKKIDRDLSKQVLYKSLAKDGQVLLTIAGTIGNASVAYKLPEFTNSNQAIANITLKDGISPFYISMYLNSKFGKLQTKRLTISSVQPNLLLVQVKNIKVPILGHDFQLLIEKLYKKVHYLRSSSNEKYSQAEQILLSELNLSNWKSKHRLSFVKNYSDTQSSSRIDAEYFQPVYEEVEKILSKYAQKTLDSLCSLINYGTVPTSPYCEIGIPYIKG